MLGGSGALAERWQIDEADGCGLQSKHNVQAGRLGLRSLYDNNLYFFDYEEKSDCDPFYFVGWTCEAFCFTENNNQLITITKQNHLKVVRLAAKDVLKMTSRPLFKSPSTHTLKRLTIFSPRLTIASLDTPSGATLLLLDHYSNTVLASKKTAAVV